MDRLSTDANSTDPNYLMYQRQQWNQRGAQGYGGGASGFPNFPNFQAGNYPGFQGPGTAPLAFQQQMAYAAYLQQQYSQAAMMGVMQQQQAAILQQQTPNGGEGSEGREGSASPVFEGDELPLGSEADTFSDPRPESPAPAIVDLTDEMDASPQPDFPRVELPTPDELRVKTEPAEPAVRPKRRGKAKDGPPTLHNLDYWPEMPAEFDEACEARARELRALGPTAACSRAECERPIQLPPSGDVTPLQRHIFFHFREPFNHCLLCDKKTRRIRVHHEECHGGSQPRFQSHLRAFVPQLRETLHLLFPPPPTRPAHFLRLVQEVVEGANGKLRCADPKCEVDVVASPEAVADHVGGHVPASLRLYECLMPKCRGKAPPDLNTLHLHFKKQHKNRFDPAKINDLRCASEGRLVSTLQSLFPGPAPPSTTPETEVEDLVEAVHAKYATSATLKCYGRECDALLEGVKGEKVSKFSIRKHVFEHIGVPRYQCNICHLEVHAITPHLKAAHGKKAGSRDAYRDSLAEPDTAAIFVQTIKACWPLEKKSPKTKDPQEDVYPCPGLADQDIYLVANSEHRKPAAFLRALDSLCSVSHKKSPCSTSHCAAFLDLRHKGRLQEHLFTHTPSTVALFSCTNCHLELRSLRALQGHKCPQKLFLDQRGSGEEELLRVLSTCLPNEMSELGFPSDADKEVPSPRRLRKPAKPAEAPKPASRKPSPAPQPPPKTSVPKAKSPAAKAKAPTPAKSPAPRANSPAPQAKSPAPRTKSPALKAQKPPQPSSSPEPEPSPVRKQTKKRVDASPKPVQTQKPPSPEPRKQTKRKVKAEPKSPQKAGARRLGPTPTALATALAAVLARDSQPLLCNFIGCGVKLLNPGESQLEDHIGKHASEALYSCLTCGKRLNRLLFTNGHLCVGDKPETKDRRVMMEKQLVNLLDVCFKRPKPAAKPQPPKAERQPPKAERPPPKTERQPPKTERQPPKTEQPIPKAARQPPKSERPVKAERPSPKTPEAPKPKVERPGPKSASRKRAVPDSPVSDSPTSSPSPAAKRPAVKKPARMQSAQVMLEKEDLGAVALRLRNRGGDSPHPPPKRVSLGAFLSCREDDLMRTPDAKPHRLPSPSPPAPSPLSAAPKIRPAAPKPRPVAPKPCEQKPSKEMKQEKPRRRRTVRKRTAPQPSTEAGRQKQTRIEEFMVPRKRANVVKPADSRRKRLRQTDITAFLRPKLAKADDSVEVLSSPDEVSPEKPPVVSRVVQMEPEVEVKPVVDDTEVASILTSLVAAASITSPVGKGAKSRPVWTIVREVLGDLVAATCFAQVPKEEDVQKLVDHLLDTVAEEETAHIRTLLFNLLDVISQEPADIKATMDHLLDAVNAEEDEVADVVSDLCVRVQDLSDPVAATLDHIVSVVEVTMELRSTLLDHSSPSSSLDPCHAVSELLESLCDAIEVESQTIIDSEVPDTEVSEIMSSIVSDLVATSSQLVQDVTETLDRLCVAVEASVATPASSEDSEAVAAVLAHLLSSSQLLDDFVEEDDAEETRLKWEETEMEWSELDATLPPRPLSAPAILQTDTLLDPAALRTMESLLATLDSFQSETPNANLQTDSVELSAILAVDPASLDPAALQTMESLLSTLEMPDATLPTARVVMDSLLDDLKAGEAKKSEDKSRVEDMPEKPLQPVSVAEPNWVETEAVLAELLDTLSGLEPMSVEEPAELEMEEPVPVSEKLETEAVLAELLEAVVQDQRAQEPMSVEDEQVEDPEAAEPDTLEGLEKPEQAEDELPDVSGVGEEEEVVFALGAPSLPDDLEIDAEIAAMELSELDPEELELSMAECPEVGSLAALMAEMSEVEAALASILAQVASAADAEPVEENRPPGGDAERAEERPPTPESSGPTTSKPTSEDALDQLLRSPSHFAQGTQTTPSLRRTKRCRGLWQLESKEVFEFVPPPLAHPIVFAASTPRCVVPGRGEKRKREEDCCPLPPSKRLRLPLPHENAVRDRLHSMITSLDQPPFQEESEEWVQAAVLAWVMEQKARVHWIPDTPDETEAEVESVLEDLLCRLEAKCDQSDSDIAIPSLFGCSDIL